MNSLVVLGASSFVGEAIISQSNCIFPIKAVARNLKKDNQSNQINVKWYRINLLIPNSLDSVLEPGDVIINLIYMHDGNESDNNLLLQNIIDSCYRKKISRFIHCSSSVVAGATSESKIDETTPCLPISLYERSKYNLEKQLLYHASNLFDIGILRPTTIVGAGGKNLLKLALDLNRSGPIVNYLRASLYKNRPMHLVPLRNVVDALMHLAFLLKPLNSGVFIISSDDDPVNTFDRVEACLIEALGLKTRKFPIIPIPSEILILLLKLRGRSDFNMAREYRSSKLISTGFIMSD